MNQLEPYPINSPILVRDVVGILWRRKWTFLIVFGIILALGLTFARIRKPRYDAQAQMIVTARGAATSTATDASTATNLSSMMETPETQIGMIMSEGMAQRTLDQLKNDALAVGKPVSSLGVTDPDLFRIDFPNNIKVVNPVDTELLEVTVTQPDPRRAATWANAICQAFVQWKKELAQETLQEITANLKIKVDAARDQVSQAERAETAYKQQHHLVDVTIEQKNALDMLTARRTDVQAATLELEAQEHRLAQLQARLAETNHALAAAVAVRDDLLTAKLQSDLNDLEIKRKAASLQYTPEFPGGLKDLDAQIDDLKSKLAAAIQGAMDNQRPSLISQGTQLEDYKQAQVVVAYDRAKLAAAVHFRDQVERELVGYPKTILEYTRLARNVDLAQQTYAQLQLALNSATLNSDTATGNVQVTQPAVPPLLPSGITLLMLIIVVVLLASILGVGAAFLAERGDHRVRSVDRIRYLVGGPVVGALPPVSRRQRRRLERGNASPEITEAYSLVRANLALALRSAGEPDLSDKHVILITSALPGEGKSVTAAELARSTARTGKSVILVDADMRRPSQGDLFNVDVALGLAEALNGTVPVEAALGKPVAENLTVLHSGVLNRNPTELISRPIMAEIIVKLRTLADVVIIDAPACALVADALLIAPNVDCILQVVSLGLPDEDLVRDTANALQAAAPRAMAYFINRAPRERARRYRSYYHYTPPPAANGNGRHDVDATNMAIAALPKPKSEQDDKISRS